MATPIRQWVCIAILAILGSTLTLAHVVKPPRADLDHAVKPPIANLAFEVKPPRANLDHVVKPQKADLAHMVKPPTANLDHVHVVNPPKADPSHVIKPSKADPAHVVKPPRATRSRKLQIDKKGETEATNFWASDSVPSGCDGGGQAQVTNPSCSFDFHNVFPFQAFPFGSVMPEVSTWREEDGGYGRSGVASIPSGN